jgi:hypothetical protein
MNATRNARKATIILGALLSAGLVLAQAPSSSQTPAANTPQAAPAERGNHHRNFDPNKQAVRLGKRLSLSHDQLAQIKPILAARFQQVRNVRADTSLTEKDRHAKVRAIVQDSNSKIEAVLNDTQKQEYEQMLAEHRAHQHNRHARAASQPQA